MSWAAADLVDKGQQLRGRQVLAAGRQKVARGVYGPLRGAAVLAPARRNGRPARQAHQVGVTAPLRILQAAQAAVGARVRIQHCLQGDNHFMLVPHSLPW